jgi:hypothetical protein
MTAEHGDHGAAMSCCIGDRAHDGTKVTRDEKVG